MYLLRQLLNRGLSRAKDQETNDPKTEIWRVCQRFSTALVEGYGRFLLLGDVEARAMYLADEANEILTNAVLPSLGLGQV